jgi:hypothetical protein
MDFKNHLQEFFNLIGRTNALDLSIRVNRYYPLMKRYPEIVRKNIHRFLPYFDDALSLPSILGIIEVIARDIPEVRDEIIKDFGPLFYEWAPFWENQPEGKTLDKILKYVNLPLSRKDKEIKNLVRSIITLERPIILVIGAGFSYDTMPITSELHPLLVSILRENGISTPTKMIQKHEEEAWKIVNKNETLFKNRFVGWCARSKIAPQHEILAEMFHEGKVSHIISFNWDDLIERAYRKKYLKSMKKINTDDITSNEPSLWKLHGDVENTSLKWVFPFEQGRIFNNLLLSLEKCIINDSPEYALIVGYSEWEKIVREQLINWLEDHIPNVLRIRPQIDDKEGNFPETAKSFFQRLHINIKNEEKG